MTAPRQGPTGKGAAGKDPAGESPASESPAGEARPGTGAGGRTGFGRGDLLGLFAILIFGSTFPASKPVLDVMDPLLFGSSRFLISALLILAWLRLRGLLPRPARADLPLLAVAGLAFACFHALWGFGLPMVPASSAAILMATSPVFGALIDMARGNRPRALAWAGMAVAFLGVVCVINNSLAGLALPTGHLLGGIVWLGASFAWALYSSFAVPLSARLGAVQAVAVTSLTGALLMLPLALWTARDGGGVDRLDTGLWLQYAYMALIGGGVSLLAWYGALRRLGTTRGIAYMYLVPVVATLLAWALLGEAITVPRLVGMAAVLCGVWLIRRGTAAPAAR